MNRGFARQVLILGFATFAIFFGAGNLIFPPFLGRLTQANYIEAMIGFLLTGVGLTFLGLLSVAITGGGIEKMGKRVFPKFGYILAVLIVLIVGPLFAIPRTCATAFELGFSHNFEWLNSWVFSIIFFGGVLFFALNPSSALDRVGKYLTPVLLLTMAVLIIKGISTPIAEVSKMVFPKAFGRGFVEGFQTMDLMASTIIGMLILKSVIQKGITDRKGQMMAVMGAGIITAICLSVVYGGLLYLGATTGGIERDLDRVQLLVFITDSVLGGYGKIALTVLVSFACLTTAIGLTMLNGEYLSQATNGKLKYKLTCIGVAVVSLIISNAGVGKIVQFAVPPLVAIYPIVIVLVAFSFISRFIHNDNVLRGAVIGAFIIGIMKSVKSVGVDISGLNAFYQSIPLVDFELGWLTISVLGGLIGYLIKGRILSIESAMEGIVNQMSSDVGSSNSGSGSLPVPGRLDIPSIVPSGIFGMIQSALGGFETAYLSWNPSFSTIAQNTVETVFDPELHASKRADESIQRGSHIFLEKIL